MKLLIVDVPRLAIYPRINSVCSSKRLLHYSQLLRQNSTESKLTKSPRSHILLNNSILFKAYSSLFKVISLFLRRTPINGLNVFRSGFIPLLIKEALQSRASPIGHARCGERFASLYLQLFL